MKTQKNGQINGQVTVNGQNFDVEDGIIQNPGKYEGEMFYVPYFWENVILYNDFEEKITIQGQTYYRVNIQKTDVENLPQLEGITFPIFLRESNQGFVSELDFDLDFWEKLRKRQQYENELTGCLERIETKFGYCQITNNQYSKADLKIDTSNLDYSGCIPPEVKQGLNLESDVYISDFHVFDQSIIVEFKHFQLERWIK